VGALIRWIGVPLVLVGCPSEVVVDPHDNGAAPNVAAGAGGKHGGAALPEDPDAYCRAQLTMWTVRLGCKSLDEGFVRKCIGDLAYADDAGCVEETIALYECAAARAQRCSSISTGCQYEAGLWRQACWPMGEGGGGASP
jgi:hypothetical protein